MCEHNRITRDLIGLMDLNKPQGLQGQTREITRRGLFHENCEERMINGHESKFFGDEA